MSRDMRGLLEDAAHEPVGLPTSEETWGAGRSRRQARRLVTVAGSAIVVAAVALGGVMLVPDTEPGPEIVDQPPATPASPQPDPSTPASPEDQAPGQVGLALAEVAVASTMSLDEGATYEGRFPEGTVVRTVDDGVSYPDRLYGRADGTVVWQGSAGIYVLAPEDEMASTLVAAPVDDGGTLSAYGLDGTSEILLEFSSAWESGIATATVRGGWLLYTAADAGTQTTVLRAPDGTQASLEDPSGEEHTLQAVALAVLDFAPRLAVVEHHVEHGDPNAPFGAGRLEIRSVNDATAQEPVRTIELPTDNVPKQLTVAGEWAYLTLLPDAPQLLQVDLHTGGIERFSAPGIVALHPGLQPRPPDAAPPADCADASGTMMADAQAYVWLPCPDAGTHEDGDPPAQFWGVHKLRLVTDPRASSGGVAQRIEVMLEAIFAGPTPEEEGHGYSPVVDPSVDALVDVVFEDGLVTIELTEEGARAASIGTSARAVSQTTVNAAIFGGSVDVDAIRLNVEGDCEAWSTYGEGPPACLTYHRNGQTTRS